MDAKHVRLLMINGVGPVMGVVQTENSEHVVLKHTVQFIQDAEGNTDMTDYLKGLQNPDFPAVFNKSCICSEGVPEEHFLTPYIETVKQLENTVNKPALFVPEQKIITQK